MKFDQLDFEILKRLQTDGRASYREIARELEVPHTTVFTRVQRMLNKGIIKRFSAEVHPHDVGFQIGLIVIDAPPSESKALAQKISQLDEARKVFRTFDGKIIVKAIVADHSNRNPLEQFLTKLNGYPMTVYPVHDVVKYHHHLHDDALRELI